MYSEAVTVSAAAMPQRTMDDSDVYLRVEKHVMQAWKAHCWACSEHRQGREAKEGHFMPGMPASEADSWVNRSGG